MLSLRRRPSAIAVAAQRLYGLAVARSRRPDLYAVMGAPDTVEGRFELLTAEIILVIERLTLEGAPTEAVRQTLFDLYIRNLDGALREMGVGDLAVGKRMKTLGRHVYGRAAAYRAALASTDPGELEGLVARTILFGREGIDAGPIAKQLVADHAELAATPIDVLLSEPLK